MSNVIKEKKLIYIANARMPTERAHGWQIMKMCEAFAYNDVRLTLIVPRRWRNPFRSDPFEFYKIQRKFRVVYLPCIDFLSLVGDGLPAILAFKLQAATFALVVLFYCLFKRSTFFTRDHFSGLLLALADKKVFFEIHDNPRPSQLMRLLMRKISGLITTNKWKGEEACRIFGLANEKIFLSYNGVDTDQFLVSDAQAICQRKLGIPQDKKLIVYAGHLYAWKGVHTLARAIQWLPQDVEILFIGGTVSDSREFEQFINQNLPLFTNRLKLFGYKRHEEVPYFLCAADVIVVPTSAKENIGSHETSPLKLFEGMAARRPLIVSDTPAAREIVSENEVNFFESDEAENLAAVISQILNNPAAAEEKTKNAWEKVRGLGWDNRAKKIINFLYS